MTRPLFRRLIPPRVREQLDDELTTHRDMLIDQLVARGVTRADAAAAADRRLGNLNAIRSEAIMVGERHQSQQRRIALVDNLSQDVRFAVRGLMRARGWTTVALLTYALGIGACVAVFSVVNSLLLHPLSYPDANRIVSISQSPTDVKGMQITVSPSADAFQAWHGHARSFDAVEGFSSTDMVRRTNESIAIVHAAAITPTFVTFAGSHLLAGRNFTAADVAAGAPHVTIISEMMWRRDFNADPGVAGRTLTLNGTSYTVIGVYPSRLQVMGPGPTSPDVWLPLMADYTEWLNVVARLKPGTTFAAAASELDTLAARAGIANAKELQAVLVRPADLVSFRSSLLMLAGAVGLVLLIACANVAHLLVARGAARDREFAIRTALGAGHLRLFRQLLTENLLLSTAGCAVGAAIGWAGLRLLISARPSTMPQLDNAHLSWQVLAAAIGAAIMTGLVFGLTGIVQVGPRATERVLKATAVRGSRQRRLRGALVITEMALAATLLVGATLLVRSVIHLQQVDPGFDAANLYSVSGVADQDAPVGLLDQLQQGLRAMPGVTGVTLVQNAPPRVGVVFGAVEPEGGKPSAEPFVWYEGILPDFFTFVHAPLVAGTMITDSTNAAAQAIVNRGFARKYFPAGEVIGKRFRLGPKQAWMTVVGVAPDLAMRGASNEPSVPIVYLPVSPLRATILVRTRPGVSVMTGIRTLLASIAPHLPPPEIESVQLAMAETLAQPRFIMLLLTLFTLIAVALAAVGLYGVLAYTVQQQTREIGIRMALGATRRHVLRRIALNGIALAATGAVAGLVIAHWATALVASQLSGIAATDPAAFVTGFAALMLIAAAASVVPARRATRIDPVVAIREE